MHAKMAWPAIAVLTLGLGGCGRESAAPDQAQHDLANATASASQNNAKAVDQVAKADQKAQQDLAHAEAQAERKTAEAAGDAVITKAEGDHDVAVAQCESLSGQAQQDCKKHADYQLNAVREKVDQLKQSSPRSVHAPPTRE